MKTVVFIIRGPGGVGEGAGLDGLAKQLAVMPNGIRLDKIIAARSRTGESIFTRISQLGLMFMASRGGFLRFSSRVAALQAPSGPQRRFF
jgi:hypothetical protein